MLIDLFKPHQKKKLSLDQKQNKLLEQFFASEYHQWIKKEATLRSSFTSLYQLFFEAAVDHFLTGPQVLLLPASGILACSLNSGTQENIIILFPDLIKILRSASPEHGMAVLAHEFGHLFHEHSRKKVGTLKAQLQADKFAYDLGLGKELLDIIMDYPEQPEFKLRSFSLGELLKN